MLRTPGGGGHSQASSPGTPRLTRSGVRPHQSTLTLEVLASPRQQVVEDVEGPLLLGLADGPGLLQKVFAGVEEHTG